MAKAGYVSSLFTIRHTQHTEALTTEEDSRDTLIRTKGLFKPPFDEKPKWKIKWIIHSNFLHTYFHCLVNFSLTLLKCFRALPSTARIERSLCADMQIFTFVLEEVEAEETKGKAKGSHFLLYFTNHNVHRAIWHIHKPFMISYLETIGK